MNPVDPSLRITLVAAVPALHQQCREPWCLIGSAAARLVGVDIDVADVDVLTTHSDAVRLMEHWTGRRVPDYEPPGDGRFRSCFARFDFPGLPLEVMGGLELDRGGGWQSVRAGTLVHVKLDGLIVPVPAPADQIRLLGEFGRGKDRQRARLLRALESAGSPDRRRAVPAPKH